MELSIRKKNIYGQLRMSFSVLFSAYICQLNRRIENFAMNEIDGEWRLISVDERGSNLISKRKIKENVNLNRLKLTCDYLVILLNRRRKRMPR